MVTCQADRIKKSEKEERCLFVYPEQQRTKAWNYYEEDTRGCSERYLGEEDTQGKLDKCLKPAEREWHTNVDHWSCALSINSLAPLRSAFKFVLRIPDKNNVFRFVCELHENIHPTGE